MNGQERAAHQRALKRRLLYTEKFPDLSRQAAVIPTRRPRKEPLQQPPDRATKKFQKLAANSQNRSAYEKQGSFPKSQSKAQAAFSASLFP